MTEVRILSFLRGFVLLFYCILNILPIALIALKAAIEEEKFFKIRVFIS